LGTSLGKISVFLNEKKTLGPWLGKETVSLNKRGHCRLGKKKETAHGCGIRRQWKPD
jgi:hypothetical protein